MTIWQGLILNGREVINAPLVVGNSVFDTDNGRITFGHELYAAATQLGNDTTNAQMVLGLGTALGMQFIIGANAVMGNDYDHVPQTNPTLYVHSAINPNVDNTQWVSVTHDQTDARIIAGLGCVRLGPTAAVDTLASFTSFPLAKFISTQAVTGHVHTGTLGVVGEAVAPAAPFLLGTGVGGVAATNGANDGRGMCGVGKVTNTADTADSIGVFGRALDVHAGGSNIGIYAKAVNGALNYSFFGEAGTLRNQGDILGTSLSTYAGASFFAGILPFNDDGAHFWINSTDGSGNNNIIITAYANQQKNHDHATASTNPTLFIHSATDPDIDNTQWVSLSHTTRHSVIESGLGRIYLTAPGGAFSNTGFYAYPDVSWTDGNFSTDTLRSNFGMLFGLRNASSERSLTLTDLAWVAKNHDHGANANPTLFIHSVIDPDIDNTQWVSFSHNQTDATILTGKGNLILDPITEITEVCGVGLKTKEYNATVNDDVKIALPASTTGWGTVMIGDNQEFARFRWTSQAVVTLDESTANVIASDTDLYLCIFDDGLNVSIRNRLGANLVVRYVIHYS
jgi:hypothetical protein